MAEINEVKGYDNQKEEYLFTVKNCTYPLQKITRDSSQISILQKNIIATGNSAMVKNLIPGDKIEFMTAPRFLGNG